MDPALLQHQPVGALAQAAYGNPLLLQQLANQRQANPRPDVTDFAGYGPTWGSFLQSRIANLQAAFPRPALEASMTPQQRYEAMAPVRGAALNLAMGIGPQMIVYHGSPALFDQFNMNKVGTGEGAQAYGHGLYLAENPAVAASYKKPGFNNFDVRQVSGGWEVSLPGGERNVFPTLKEADAHMSSMGNLYKVDLPDEHIAKMLDWDKPINQQPDSVKAALQSVGWFKNPNEITRTFGEEIRNVGGLDAEAASQLRAAGIPGIRYLDQGSRSGGNRTSNFVVFDDQIPKIVGRE